jgi:Putative transposase
MRSPISLARLRFTPGTPEVLYRRKGGHDAGEEAEGERIPATEFVARVLVQIPDPKRHLVRYYGFYSNVARGKRKKAAAAAPSASSPASDADQTPTPGLAVLRRRWADLIRRVYEVDPLVCPRCGGEMRVIGFITEPGLIKRILDHLRKRDQVSRPPPRAVTTPA